MMNVIISEGTPPIPIWIDVQDPGKEELIGLAENYRLHPTLVQDCMEPEHLPKHERYEDTTFIIIRHYDSDSHPLDDSIQGMTRKIALFLGERFLISIHRKDQQFLQDIREKYRKKGSGYLQVILLEILMGAVETYHKPLEEAEIRIHDFETAILRDEQFATKWEEVFRIKCRLMVMKRMLWHSLNTVQKFIPFSHENLPLRQDLRERIENLHFFADSLLDDLSSLLSVQMALTTNRATDASNKMNQVMKVLTVFSAFFLPLNFIVGIYGMNFEYMPELKWRYGYFAVWGVLLGVVVTIYTWFVRKGWIRWGHMS